MAIPSRVLLSMDSMRIFMDDGTFYNAYPTSTQAWIVPDGSGGGGTDPGGDGTFRFPFPTDQITSYFRPEDRPNHDGIDFGRGASNVEGTPIPAAAAGTVTVSGDYFGYGKTVILDHGILTVGSHAGKRFETLYGHMVEPGSTLSVGATVITGETLGGIGNTGLSEGNHLHWEVWLDGEKVDPYAFMLEYQGLTQ